jgi:hypothetical protein
MNLRCCGAGLPSVSDKQSLTIGPRRASQLLRGASAVDRCRSLLLDRDRRQAFDQVDVGLSINCRNWRA